MKKIIIPLILLSLVIGASIIFLNRPRTLNTNLADNTSERLILPSGFKLTAYSKFSSAPRALATDSENTIFVSFPDSGKIIALINKSNSNQPDETKEILNSLNYPNGLAYYNNKLFVAEEDKVSRYDWNKQTHEAKLEKILFNLPVGGIHRTRGITFDNLGNLYVSIGSSCNVCQETDPWRAAVIMSDFEGNNPTRFATGLRNTVFMAKNPSTNEIWGGDMGRDQLGDNLPSDEINIIKNGQNYGWPFCYNNKTLDTNFINQSRLNVSQNICQNTVSPIFEIPAHSAPLGLTFINSSKYPYNQQDLLVAYHGSWNSSVPIGYKVVHLKINNNNVIYAEDFITGFVQNNSIIGRPVDLLFDSHDNLFLSDDKANLIYKINYLP